MVVLLVIIGGFVFEFIGFMCGVRYRTNLERKKTIGSLRIDRSDASDNPYLFLEASGGVEAISKEKWVVLTVNTENFIPHK